LKVFIWRKVKKKKTKQTGLEGENVGLVQGGGGFFNKGKSYNQPNVRKYENL